MFKKCIWLAAFAALACGTTLKADNYPTKVCVVSGDNFGGDLGDPVDVNYKGRTVRLCCKSCVKTFNKNPEKYIKKLDELTKANGGK